MPTRRKLTRPSELIARLRRRETVAAEELTRRLRAAQAALAGRIEAAAERRQLAMSSGAREKVYRGADGIYETLNKGVDSWLKDQAYKTIVEWHDQAAADMKALGVPSRTIVRFDREHVNRVWGLVTEDNDKHLAAVLTEKLAATDKRQLRQAFVDTYRQGAVEGWTAREHAKELQARWDKVAGDVKGDRFIDAGGRRWTNAQYMQMLTRTTMHRGQLQAYVETLVSSGYTLARIADDGDPCPICQAWAGVIIDLTGVHAGKYPTLQEAFDSKWGHPNCTCRLEYVDETVDESDIARQGEASTPEPPADWNNREAVRAYVERVAEYGELVRQR